MSILLPLIALAAQIVFVTLTICVIRKFEKENLHLRTRHIYEKFLLKEINNTLNRKLDLSCLDDSELPKKKTKDVIDLIFINYKNDKKPAKAKSNKTKIKSKNLIKN